MRVLGGIGSQHRAGEGLCTTGGGGEQHISPRYPIFEQKDHLGSASISSVITGVLVYARAGVFSHCCGAVAHFEARRSLSSSSSSLCLPLQCAPTKDS